MNKRLKLAETGRVIDLPAYGTWPAAGHVFEQEEQDAIEAALAACRPLLIRGEPGTGKSQLARAAARHAAPAERAFVSEVVHARSESRDLLWRFDAVGRLGKAQALGAVGLKQRRIEEQLAAVRFLSPGVLWWVFDWKSAENLYRDNGCRGYRPQRPEGWAPEHGSVLLIDEIDKADADLPNGLLETLGNGAFAVPDLPTPVTLRPGIPPPLVVITTNEERELPAAFVRRCFVLHLWLPDEAPRYAHDAAAREEKLREHLVARGRAHFRDRISSEIYAAAAEQLACDRAAARAQGLSKPGLAEYVDLLRALDDLAPGDAAKQTDYLKRIGKFALRKSPLRSGL